MIQPFRIKGGKSQSVSKEQIRAFFTACYAVLGYHGLYPKKTVDVYIKKSIPGRTVVEGGPIAGQWHPLDSKIEIADTSKAENMLSIILHEVIHSVIQFPPETLEKCTSTLTGKLKPDVCKLAELLLENTYQRAAYIAHTKISYRAKAGDHYDNDQYVETGVKSKYVVSKLRKSIKAKKRSIERN